MNELISNRFEKKYILDESQFKSLHELIKKHLKRDPYMPKDTQYHVYNLYFDTDDYSFIRRSLERPIYKDKFRLRAYHMPVHGEDLVFFEIKKKFQGRINKRRIQLPYKEAKKYLYQHQKPSFLSITDQQIFQEVDYLISRNGQLSPRVYIAYDRLAYLNNTNSFRITFDTNIRFRTHDLHLESDESKPILADPKGALMEVKSTRNFPLWLVKELSKLTIYSQRFSKYGKTYQQILQGGKTYDYFFLDDSN